MLWSFVDLGRGRLQGSREEAVGAATLNQGRTASPARSRSVFIRAHARRKLVPKVRPDLGSVQEKFHEIACDQLLFS
jgi:hypothetical protein